MKLAFVTDNGISISKHFGRARFYEILHIEEGKVVSRERRDKMGHAQFAGESHSHTEHTRGEQGQGRGVQGHGWSAQGHGFSQRLQHGFDPAAQDRHSRMAQIIQDCQYLVSGGMGTGAYESMKQAGIKPIVTELNTIEEAVKAFLAGSLKDHTEYLH